MAATAETTWHPADVFSGGPKSHKESALVVLNQPLELHASVYTKIWGNSVYRVAVDGGANRIHDLNISSKLDFAVDLVIGDLDSLLPDVRKYWEQKGVSITHDPDQYTTDFTKAVNHIWSSERAHPKDITVLGGLGGRVDQGISVLHHLYMFQKDYTPGKMFLLSSEGITFVLKSGKHKIKARENFGDIYLGKHVGIIPLKEPSTITTKGLEWDVTDWETDFGGQISTSNHVNAEWVTIETTKDVLFTIDFNTASQESG
ncbi:Thiamine pyrophosphokinase, catalytic [Venustampulla echinocandica]|uniref:Thiamine pyrophosphokinase n=1 Tax=Venustampulla echinocandica TaxID=2656787 RepID=A0A370TCI7_9HELO|nr:Thiamine pyrophosphokinase, catalytic [Venustampulla echinocandica]RDL31969.1 Thiamine pyrophosphokinase, catalytic [Venustampulla echinocandica]